MRDDSDGTQNTRGFRESKPSTIGWRHRSPKSPSLIIMHILDLVTTPTWTLGGLERNRVTRRRVEEPHALTASSTRAASDAFLFPFDNNLITNASPDEGVYIPLQEKVLHRYMQQAGIDRLPDSFDGYLAFVGVV